MRQERFFTDPRLPFVECRVSQASVRTFKPHIHGCFSIGAVTKGGLRFRAADRSRRCWRRSAFSWP